MYSKNYKSIKIKDVYGNNKGTIEINITTLFIINKTKNLKINYNTSKAYEPNGCQTEAPSEGSIATLNGYFAGQSMHQATGRGWPGASHKFLSRDSWPTITNM